MIGWHRRPACALRTAGPEARLTETIAAQAKACGYTTSAPKIRAMCFRAKAWASGSKSATPSR